MAATFHTVNNATVIPEPNNHDDDSLNAGNSPTPQTQTQQTQQMQQQPMHHNVMGEDATTPTRASFGSAGAAATTTTAAGSASLAAQKPLPTSPFPQAVQVPEPAHKSSPKREDSQHSRKSRDSEDVEMNDSDGEDGGDDAGSDDESVNADGTKSKSKKKSQRFYCTDYPPCNLSFTRSEHLARHIRKHTGERPFQCHCSRRFSRLDNLRQHAQTVHVNEDIPIDSLAAVGTRFVRQVRPDRSRQNGRARASTAGSVGPPVRGHSKSLSTSSIGSIGSSGYSAREDAARRRPPPLVMAGPRISLESYRTGAGAGAADSQYLLRAPSPSDFSTPTSATFSTGQSSPRWGSGVASPTSSHSRTQSMYVTGSRTPGRRLSVPSSGISNPFQSPGTSLGRPLFGPSGLNSSNSGVFSPASGAGSMISSPTTSSASGWPRRESMSTAADEAWRRRTWHPDSREYSAGGSRLSNVITPGQFQTAPIPGPLPLAIPNSNNPPNGQQSTVRLPGIESFDPIPRTTVTPPRRIPSPMAVDPDNANANAATGPATLLPSAESSLGEERRLAQWDMSLHRGLTRLDITSNTPPRESSRDSAGAWASEVNTAVQARAEHVRTQPTVRFDTEARVVPIPTNTGLAMAHSHGGGHGGHGFRGHQHTVSAPSIATSRESKRRGWYHGPVTVHPDIHEVSERPHVDRIHHPNFDGFTAFPAREPRAAVDQSSQDVNMDAERAPQSDSMRRLEALVAVATSESSAAAAY